MTYRELLTRPRKFQEGELQVFVDGIFVSRKCVRDIGCRRDGSLVFHLRYTTTKTGRGGRWKYSEFHGLFVIPNVRLDEEIKRKGSIFLIDLPNNVSVRLLPGGHRGVLQRIESMTIPFRPRDEAKPDIVL